MKALPPEDPKQERRKKTAPGSALRKVLPIACSLATGCAGVPVRPAPFTCPEGAIAARKQLHWTESQRFSLLIDDRYGIEGYGGWLRAGDTVVGVVQRDQWDNPWAKKRVVLPKGTRFLGGKVYVEPKKTETDHPGRVFVKYERVKLPQQEELPVCFIVETVAFELKDGAARTLNRESGSVVDWWP